jgi:hypothetical protein
MSAIERHHAAILNLIEASLPGAAATQLLWAVDCTVAYGLGWRRNTTPGRPISLDSTWPRAFNWLVYLMWPAVRSANKSLIKNVNGLNDFAKQILDSFEAALEVAMKLANWFAYPFERECHNVVAEPALLSTGLEIDRESDMVLPGGRRAFRAEEPIRIIPSSFLLPPQATIDLDVTPAWAKLTLAGRAPGVKLRDGEEFEIEGALALAGPDGLREVAAPGHVSKFSYHAGGHFVDSPTGQIVGRQGRFIAQSVVEVRFVRRVDSLNVIRGEADGAATAKLVDGPMNKGRELDFAVPETLRLKGRMLMAECRCGSFNCRQNHSLAEGLKCRPRATFSTIVATAVHGNVPILVKSFAASMYYAFLANGHLGTPNDGEEGAIPTQIRAGVTPLPPQVRQYPLGEWKEHHGAAECLVLYYPDAPFDRDTRIQCTAEIRYPFVAGDSEPEPCSCLNPPGALNCLFCGNILDGLDTTSVWTSKWPNVKIRPFKDYQGGGPDGRDPDGGWEGAEGAGA